MTRVTADELLRSKLANFFVPVDICDEYTTAEVLEHLRGLEQQ
jgi:hypothetical protein